MEVILNYFTFVNNYITLYLIIAINNIFMRKKVLKNKSIIFTSINDLIILIIIILMDQCYSELNAYYICSLKI